MLRTTYVDSASGYLHAHLMQAKSTDMSDEKRYPARGPLARNLRALMATRDWSQSDLARASGVSQRHISDILRARTDTTAAVLERLGAPFQRRGFELLVDGLHEEIAASSGRLSSLVSAYVRDPRVRKFLDDAFDLAVPRKKE